MTPNELYKREPVSTSHDLWPLCGCYYNHLPELQERLSSEAFDGNEKVEVRYYKDFNFDYRRVWRLASVWYDGRPVMIVQNAGREGDDHRRRFITDLVAYGEMIGYLIALFPRELEQPEDVVDPDTEVVGLTSFYNCELDGVFTKSVY